MKASSLIRIMLFAITLNLLIVPVMAAESPELVSSDSDIAQSVDTEEGSSSVLQGFVSKENKDSDIVSIDDKTKRIVMFVMGVPLLILLIITAALGIAMGVYGKPVFLPHLICAGLSLTLAMAHAVAGIVWFYPF